MLILKGCHKVPRSVCEPHSVPQCKKVAHQTCHKVGSFNYLICQFFFLTESHTAGDKEGVQGCPKAKVQVCAQTSLPLPAQGEVQLCAEAAVPVGAHPELLCSAKAALRGRAAGGVPPGAPRAVPQGAAAALRDSCSAAL